VKSIDWNSVRRSRAKAEFRKKAPGADLFKLGEYHIQREPKNLKIERMFMPEVER